MLKIFIKFYNIMLSWDGLNFERNIYGTQKMLYEYHMLKKTQKNRKGNLTKLKALHPVSQGLFHKHVYSVL